MQQAMISRLCLFFLLFATTVLSTPLSDQYTETKPAYSIPRPHLIQQRQEANLTAFYLKRCGVNYVDCGNRTCCVEGNECLVVVGSGEIRCGATSLTPSASPSPSPSTSSTPSKPTPVGAIVGGVVGGFGIFAIIGAYYYIQRRNNPPVIPDLPQAHCTHNSNIVEAKYPPATDTAYTGDNWQPGQYLNNNRNRSISAASAHSPYDMSPSGFNYFNKPKAEEVETPYIVELPDSIVTPTLELPGDGYFPRQMAPVQEHTSPTSPVQNSPIHTSYIQTSPIPTSPILTSPTPTSPTTDARMGHQRGI